MARTVRLNMPCTIRLKTVFRSVSADRAATGCRANSGRSLSVSIGTSASIRSFSACGDSPSGHSQPRSVDGYVRPDTDIECKVHSVPPAMPVSAYRTTSRAISRAKRQLSLCSRINRTASCSAYRPVILTLPEALRRTSSQLYPTRTNRKLSLRAVMSRAAGEQDFIAFSIPIPPTMQTWRFPSREPALDRLEANTDRPPNSQPWAEPTESVALFAVRRQSMPRQQPMRRPSRWLNAAAKSPVRWPRRSSGRCRLCSPHTRLRPAHHNNARQRLN